jgi:hypothetical protein
MVAGKIVRALACCVATITATVGGLAQ